MNTMVHSSYNDFTLFCDEQEAIEFLRAGQGNIIQQSEAVAFSQDEGIKLSHLAIELGKPDYAVRQMSRVGRCLIKPVKEMVLNPRIRLGFHHARVIAGYEAGEQEAIAREAIVRRKSVRDLEADKRGFDKRLDKQTERFYQQLSDKFFMATGLNITIVPDNDNKHAGQVMLRYKDLAEFDAIADRLNIDLSED
ncbi:hypothetical protein GZ77_25950 [Endozoicomonas montiporae]|uniref:ParB/Spo0J HTH domain-containing protein n=1 Tax=Endozoicomonas montiporae TaxID=1027273 RepID=A0A081MYQ7_9GAMM|nr:hypothetical protein [Endozoicomonas montiporae]KEQ11330.1 hypothetical protein GZ77_25950 [Endozoicomonas montiporae]